MAKILVIHGPNLNRLGLREPEIYGSATLDEINQRVGQIADAAGHDLQARQSNAEHELVGFIHDAADQSVDYIVINPAAFTHTSIALRDAMLSCSIPFIEVHLSNVHQRENYRRHSYFSDIATGTICGLGIQGYVAAVEAAIRFVESDATGI